MISRLSSVVRLSSFSSTPPLRVNGVVKNLSVKLNRSYSESLSSPNASDETPVLDLTDSCVKQIHKIAGSESFLRVLIESGGCSGFQYKFEIDNHVGEDDLVFEKEGAKVVIDCDSLKLIGGSVIDFHSELIRSAFRVLNNPKAEHGCSCGASFNVKL